MEEDRARTVLLTTHDMVEADALCDRVAIINGGRVLACDTPARSNAVCTATSSSTSRPRRSEPRAQTRWPHGPAWSARPIARASDPILGARAILKDDHVLASVMSALDARGARLLNLAKREATLEDVFVTLVGRRLDEADESRKVAG